jgi:hypothetical protein
MSRNALLLFLSSAGLGLGGLRFSQALLELVHATGRIYKFLRAGVEGMADVANTEENDWFGGASLDDVAAGATNFRVHIFRMYISFHNKGAKTYQPRTGWQVLNRMKFRSLFAVKPMWLIFGRC